MRVGLKIAYDGREFHGFARQPDVRTVEGEIAFALAKAGMIADAGAANVRGASRTDAGVSAVGNVVAFDTHARLDEITGRFNDAAKDVWAWAIADLPPGFDPRRARVRWYRYALAGDHEVAGLTRTATAFVGTQDFAAFASPDAGRTRRHIDSIDVTPDAGTVLVDVRAPSFLRGMVRRIVSALLAVERGDAAREDLAAALAAGRGPDFGLAPAEPLVLMDVDIGFPFRPAADRATRERIAHRSSEADVRARFWREAARRILPVDATRSPVETGVAGDLGRARGNH